MIYISSDHGGFELKNRVLEFLKQKGAEVEDLGPFELNPADDFPDFANVLAQKVVKETGSKGILICRNGVGVCVAANKFAGIRATLSWTPKHAFSARNDDDTNVLCLPADYVNANLALEIVDIWLNTPFSGEERFVKRLKKIK